MKKTIILKAPASMADVYAMFHYDLRGDTLALEGSIKNHAARIIFTRKRKKDYPLLTRGFHWVNASPYNR